MIAYTSAVALSRRKFLLEHWNPRTISPHDHERSTREQWTLRCYRRDKGQLRIPSRAKTCARRRTQRYGAASIKYPLHEKAKMDAKTKGVPWQMNRQLTYASTLRGQKCKFHRSCPGGSASHAIPFV